MAKRITVAELAEQMAEQQAAQQAQIDKLVSVIAGLAQQAAETDKPKTDKPKAKDPDSWIRKFPDYGTAAQRVEFDKLVKVAKEQRAAIEKATGSKAVRAFIPVAKQQDRMPHSIQWTVTY